MKTLPAQHMKAMYSIATLLILLWLLVQISTPCFVPGDLLPPLAKCYIGGGSCS